MGLIRTNPEIPYMIFLFFSGTLRKLDENAKSGEWKMCS